MAVAICSYPYLSKSLRTPTTNESCQFGSVYMISEKELATRLLLADFDSDNLEIVPLGSPEGLDEDYELPPNLPILPVRNTVLFPGMVIPVTVGRAKSIRLVKKPIKETESLV